MNTSQSKLAGRLCRLCRADDGNDPEDTENESVINYYEEAGSLCLFGPICIHTVLPVKRFLEKFGVAYKNARFRKKFGIDSLTITVNSWGGVTGQGLALHDLIRSCRFPIDTVALGEVASAAMMPYLAGRRRYIYQNALLLTHHSSQESVESQNLRRADWYHQRGRDLDLLNRMSANIILGNSNLTQKALARLQREEMLITAEEAVKYGLAHEIIKNR